MVDDRLAPATRPSNKSLEGIEASSPRSAGDHELSPKASQRNRDSETRTLLVLVYKRNQEAEALSAVTGQVVIDFLTPVE